MRKLCVAVAVLIAAASADAQTTQCGTTFDRTAPVFPTLADIVATTESDAIACGAFIASIPQPDVRDVCPIKITLRGVPAGNLFPVGVTTLVWDARDASGNASTALQRVIVTDATPPLVAATGERVILATSLPVAGAVTAPNAADNCGDVVVTASNPGPYPQGITNIIWTATDASGNSAVTTQQITVIPAATITIASAVVSRHGSTTVYTPMPIELRIVDATEVRNFGKRAIEAAWHNATPLAAPYIDLTGPALTTVPGGTVDSYIAVVPADRQWVVLARNSDGGLLYDRP